MNICLTFAKTVLSVKNVCVLLGSEDWTINNLTVISSNFFCKYVMTCLSVALKFCSKSLSWSGSRYLGRVVLVCLAKDWNFSIAFYSTWWKDGWWTQGTARVLKHIPRVMSSGASSLGQLHIPVMISIRAAVILITMLKKKKYKKLLVSHCP